MLHPAKCLFMLLVPTFLVFAVPKVLIWEVSGNFGDQLLWGPFINICFWIFKFLIRDNFHIVSMLVAIHFDLKLF